MNNIDIDKTQKLMKVLESAFDVAYFSKINTYPKEGTPEFFEFAQKLDVLATSINSAYPSFNKNIQNRKDGKACDNFSASEWENTVCENCSQLEKEH